MPGMEALLCLPTLFRSILEEVIRSSPGALRVSLMGTDGIPIEEVGEDGGASGELVAVEYAALQKRIATTNRGLDLAPLDEFSISTSEVCIVVRMVTADYFLLLLLASRTGFGRARYELRKAGLRLKAEFV